jgi:hypothetical protein
MDFVSRDHEWTDRAERFLKAELKHADVTCEELARRPRETDWTKRSTLLRRRSGAERFQPRSFFGEHLSLGDV